MRSIPGGHLGRLQLLVAALAAVVAITGQPTLARAGNGHPLNGVESLMSTVTENRPVRVAASAGPVRDAGGHVWQPDAPYAVGGRLVASAHTIRHTSSQVLYQRSRLGARSYHFPVSTPGTYFVDMFIAETRGARPAQRLWDVTGEGRLLARSVDIAQMNGHNRAGHVLFFVPVIDGTLNLRMVARHGLPLVGAIEVDWRKTATVDRTLFSDTFDGPADQPPNGLNWTYDKGGNGWGNHEQQTYTAQPTNASLDGDGHLLITARKQDWTGPDGIARHYTSARLKTAGRFTFRYGVAEARIQVPEGDGLWPAWWALGDNFDSVGWPQCGELDIMENIGSRPRVTHATAHGGRVGGRPWQSGGKLRLSEKLGWAYRTYQLVWGPSAISMSVDGRTYSSVSTADINPNAHWNFDHPFYLLLDLAVGGSWPGPPNASTQFPAVMSVDSVTVRG